MAIRFADSFKHYNTLTLMERKYNTVFARSSSFQATAGRYGTQCFRFDPGGNSAFGHAINFDNQATFVIGVAFKLNNTSGRTAIYLLSLIDATTPQIVISLNQNNNITLYRGQTASSFASLNTLGTTSFNFKLGTWYYLELKVTINSSTGSYELRINGNNVLSASGVNTRSAGSSNNYANAIWFGNPLSMSGNFSTTAQCDLEDFYVCDGTGGVNDDFLGDIRVEALFPNGEGANLAWTCSTGSTHNTLVNETTPNDDTNYVSSGTASQKDTYTFGDLATTAGTIKGIQIAACARKDDAGTRTIASIIRQSSTDYISSNNQNIGNTYTYYLQPYDVNPATSAAFTISEVNAHEYGEQLVA